MAAQSGNRRGGGAEEGAEWGLSSYTLNKTQQNLIEHSNRVIPNCPTAAASVQRRNQSLNLCPFSFSVHFFASLVPHFFPPASLFPTTRYSFRYFQSIFGFLKHRTFFYYKLGKQEESIPFFRRLSLLFHIPASPPAISVSPPL